jgi:hypothetical protein
MAITVTVEDGTGIAGANAYASIADSDTYFETRPRSDAWLSTDADVKAQLLIHATRVLDVSVLWDGDPLSSTQALAFPRVIEDESVGIPTVIKTALFELVWSLKDVDVTAQPATSGITSLKVGPIEIQSDAMRPSPIVPRFVADMVAAYGRPRASATSVRLTRR